MKELQKKKNICFGKRKIDLIYTWPAINSYQLMLFAEAEEFIGKSVGNSISVFHVACRSKIAFQLL